MRNTRPALALAQRAAGVFGDLLFPRRCPFCDGLLGAALFCPRCAPALKALERAPYRLEATEHQLAGLEGAASLYHYKDTVRQAVRAMKFHRRPWYGREFGYLVAQRLFGCTFTVQHGIITVLDTGLPRLEYDLVVSVPGSHKDRGYDATARMAATLAQALGLPFLPGALVKTRATHPQVGLSAKERLVNLQGAFHAAKPHLLEGRRVLLVDDVITTGATVSEGARALGRGGALSVFAVSLAASAWEGPQNQDKEHNND